MNVDGGDRCAALEHRVIAEHVVDAPVGEALDDDELVIALEEVGETRGAADVHAGAIEVLERGVVLEPALEVVAHEGDAVLHRDGRNPVVAEGVGPGQLGGRLGNDVVGTGARVDEADYEVTMGLLVIGVGELPPGVLVGEATAQRALFPGVLDDAQGRLPGQTQGSAP